MITATSGRQCRRYLADHSGYRRNYGLKQTRNYDARRDIVASTTAALDMMQRLNKMFDGDWLLTVAAYNSGEGRVMKRNQSEQISG